VAPGCIVSLVPAPSLTYARRVIQRSALLLSLLAAAAVSCHSHTTTTGKHDAGVDGASCSHDGGTQKTNGTPCGCDGDCASGFCVDGVCCNTACTETCKSCHTMSAPGTCSYVAAGDLPRSPAVCPKSDPTTCGLDGACDGKGGCRSYVTGTVCQAGTCDGASVGGIQVCDGAGACKPGAATVCAPFNCDTRTNACVSTCSSDADCASNVKCVNGSCGLKPIGAVCSASKQCASGFCADGFCCNVACAGPCVSCSQSGRIGTCWPTAMGIADPHKLCLLTDKSACGQTGACDGLGGCSKYAPETVCVPPSCSGTRLNTAGTCNGLGTCRPPGVQSCDPYQCTNGACVNHCTSDMDCVTGHTCQNGSCGPKAPGQPCSTGTECGSGFCADGVCCTTACGESCRSCALSTSLGTCAPVPKGAGDPRGVCVDKQAASCGDDGTCDGAGGCHKYPAGTECASEKCAAGIYTPTSTCDDNGNCRAPDALACAPYVCNGLRCYVSCSGDANCSTGNVCAQGSCGLKPNGSFCSSATECQSGQCAQGVCCATACGSSCFSCAMTGTMGLCTAVPTGLPDPAGQCSDLGASSCGNDGKCQAGACQKYQQGTACAGATCPMPGTTFTAGATCDGSGTCSTPTATSCSPFTCGANACKSVCTGNADCAAPASCINGSCGLKPDGAICQLGAECQSSTCAQGVCCHTACAGTCMSCSLTGSAGTCSPVPSGGSDPTGQCTDKGAASCGTTGFCNGAGACQLYAAGVQCAAPVCQDNAHAATARTCDGAGTCKQPTVQTCSPFMCSNTTQSCIAVCSGDGDCVGINVCNPDGSCGLKRLGQICAASAECDSKNCVDGVCCSSASCGTCQICNLTGAAGSCQPVATGAAEPHARCSATPPCGLDGTCDGDGACRNTSAGTSCGSASCTGSTSTPVGSCDGDGLCQQPHQDCPGHYVCGATTCLTTCAGSGDCASGYNCISGTCTNLKPNGTTCSAGTDCASTICTDGVCCNSVSCGACSACNVNGSGTCAPIPAGTTCGAAACSPGTATLVGASECDGAGACVPGATTDCTPQACASAACTLGCASAADCAPGYSCQSASDGGVDGGPPQCRM